MKQEHVIRAENVTKADTPSRTRTFTISTSLTNPQVLARLRSITTGEFHDAKADPGYKYYGTITGTAFHLCNKKYGPYSSGPWIKGAVSELGDKTVVIIETDIEERIDMVSKFMYPFLIAFGLLAMAAGANTPENRQIFTVVGAGLVVSPFALMAVTRRLLKSMEGDEVKQFEKALSGNGR